MTALGRYDAGLQDEDRHEVRLLGTPVRVFAAGRDHHDDLLREFALLALSDQPPTVDSGRLGELTEVLGVRYGAATARPSAEIDAAIAEGSDTVDLVFTVPGSVVDAAAELEALMDEADRFCESEALLTVSRSPVVRAFSAWYLDEFRRQVAGQAPTSWEGPLDP